MILEWGPLKGSGVNRKQASEKEFRYGTQAGADTSVVPAIPRWTRSAGGREDHAPGKRKAGYKMARKGPTQHLHADCGF